MSIVANHYAFVVGVDTHARTHTYAIISLRTGEVLGTKAFAVTDAAIDRAIAWTTSHTNGQVLFALEGSGSYGASLARSLRRGAMSSAM